MTLSVIHLVRHGEVYNPGKVLYGRLPGYRLSKTGCAMADAVADWLTRRPGGVDRVLASPLLRARQTAAPIGAAFGLKTEIDPRLIEAGSRIEGRQPTARTFLRPSVLPLLRNPLRPSWGEPYERIANRMWLAVRDALTEAPGAHTAIVSHQLPIWTLRSYVSGQRLWHDPRSRRCALASVTTLSFTDGVLTAIGYDEPAAGLPALDVVS